MGVWGLPLQPLHKWKFARLTGVSFTDCKIWKPKNQYQTSWITSQAQFSLLLSVKTKNKNIFIFLLNMYSADPLKQGRRCQNRCHAWTPLSHQIRELISGSEGPWVNFNLKAGTKLCSYKSSVASRWCVIALDHSANHLIKFSLCRTTLHVLSWAS